MYPVHHIIGAYTDFSALVVEGIDLRVEVMLVSLVLSIVISWTFRPTRKTNTVMFTKY